MTMQADGMYKCSCGAVYTLETLPETCTGTRDGRPCRVEHFGSWARSNAKIKAADERHSAEDARACAGLKAAAARVRAMPRMDGRPKWLDPLEEEKQKAEFARLNAEIRASADRGHPELEKIAEEIREMPRQGAMDSEGRPVHVGDRVLYRGGLHTIKALPAGKRSARGYPLVELDPTPADEADEVSIDRVDDV